MLVDVLGENVGDTFPLLPPFEDDTIKVVFVEMAGEYIDRLIFKNGGTTLFKSSQ